MTYEGLRLHISKIRRKCFSKYRNRRLKNKDFTIISNNSTSLGTTSSKTIFIMLFPFFNKRVVYTYYKIVTSFYIIIYKKSTIFSLLDF